ncbi:MAG: MBL fold metallo-hydrolase [Chloroflexi bacterium]|nr:MBL fold metallo-hydrolase [Chloroflexota bacterium]
MPGIHQIPVPTPFYVGPVNLYLLEGDPLTLIDCGPATDEAFEALNAGLAAAGHRLADLEQVVITHHHTDHVGLVNRVIAESQATLLAHEYTRPYLKDPEQKREFDLAFYIEVCREGGVPPRILQSIGNMTRWIEQFGNRPIDIDRVLHEGDMIQAGDIAWQVYHTPGHAGDLICLFDASRGVLLASDHLILKISSNPLIEPAPVPDQRRPQRLVEYITHLQRMAVLDPSITFSGHGEPIADVPALVEERVAFHHQRADKIVGYFDDRLCNLWQVTERMFAHVGDDQKFLALSEVLGHIDLLETRGQLQRVYQDGVVYWQRC